MCNQTLLNNNRQFEFLDLLNIASFCIGLMNFDQNLTQNDKQDLEEELNKSLQKLLQELHGHLQAQDAKLDLIMKKLEELEHDS